MNNAVYLSLRNRSVGAPGAGRILATLILGLTGAAACAQNNASGALSSPPASSLTTSSAVVSSSVQAASLDQGGRRGASSARVSLPSSAPDTAQRGTQAASSTPGSLSVRSLAPPSLGPQTVGPVPPAYGGVIYGSVGGERDFAVRTAPQASVQGHDAWAGPVLPDELVRERRRLSREERLRLRSDIRDVSRNMYERPRGRH